MGSKPLRTKRKSASIESCLRPLGATIDMATPDMWTSNRLWEGGIVALIFTKRQLKGRGGYWVVSPSGNCCPIARIPVEVEHLDTFQDTPKVAMPHILLPNIIHRCSDPCQEVSGVL